jgi:hypothetical protein
LSSRRTEGETVAVKYWQQRIYTAVEFWHEVEFRVVERSAHLTTELAKLGFSTSCAS